MESKREIGRLQDDIKALRAANQAVRFILGGVASRDWVNHSILGRRVGSAWSHNHLFLEPVDDAAPKIAPKNQFHQQAPSQDIATSSTLIVSHHRRIPWKPDRYIHWSTIDTYDTSQETSSDIPYIDDANKDMGSLTINIIG
ncbi:MAG: hypothetical protein Q9211_004218 [Gyalolechia sp. 1 TL-2023]